jgi:DNA helicase HerA-like ATPase
MTKLIQLSKDYSITVIDYAIAGNAILGIKEAGKTVTAKKLAEGLMDNGVPIVVFDPSGVWKHLRVGKNGRSGYPVVVIGNDEDSDLELSQDTIGDVVLASLQDLWSNK